MIQVKDLKLNDANPRFIRDERFQKLKDSIEQFPKMMKLRPIVVDKQNIVLGGNMRLRALIDLGYKSIPGEWVKKADELNEEEKRRFIIADNTGFGEWDYELLANEWDSAELETWGMELPDWAALSPDELGEDFTLPDGDREPFQQMTFTLADEQAERIKTALADAKKTPEYEHGETFGNENSNGNALFVIVSAWAEQRT